MRKGDAMSLLLLDVRALGEEPVTEHRFAPPRRWRFDLAFPSKMVAVEVDGATWTGGRHTTGAGHRGDCEKRNAATLAGWRVFTFSSDMIREGEHMDVLSKALEVRR